jgi:hypothetical protein
MGGWACGWRASCSCCESEWGGVDWGVGGGRVVGWVLWWGRFLLSNQSVRVRPDLDPFARTHTHTYTHTHNTTNSMAKGGQGSAASTQQGASGARASKKHKGGGGGPSVTWGERFLAMVEEAEEVCVFWGARVCVCRKRGGGC